MSAELLPCPFCGCSKNIAMANEKHDHSGGYFIACPRCHGSTGLRYAMGDDPRPLLIEQWNRRATQPQAPQGAVTPGFQLVPIEPTEEMCRAALNCQDHDPEDPPESEMYCLYQAMIAAAPMIQAPKVVVTLQRMTFDSDCFVNGRFIKAGTEIHIQPAAPKTETPEGEI